MDSELNVDAGGRNHLRVSGLRRDATLYLSLILLSPVLGLITHFIWPLMPTFKGQTPGILAQVFVFALAVVAWLFFPRKNSANRGTPFDLLMAGFFAFSCLVIAISIIHQDLFNHTAWLFPLSVLMIWIKPPDLKSSWKAADVLMFALVVVCLLTQIFEWFGLSTGWSEFPLRWSIFPDFLEIPSRWEGPFGNVNYAGPIGAYILVYGVFRSGALRLLFLFAGGWIILVAQTRASFVSVLATLAVIILFLPAKGRFSPSRSLKILIAVGAFVSVAGFITISAVGLNGRQSIWPAYVRASLDSPFLGMSNARIEYLQTTGVLPREASHAHSLFLDSLDRYGLSGLLVLSALSVASVWIAIRAARAGTTVALAMLIAFAVNGIVDTTLDWRYLSVFLAPLFVCLIIASRVPEVARQTQAFRNP
jgi:hypothetical protein